MVKQKTTTLKLGEICDGGLTSREEGREVLVLILKWWKLANKIVLDFQNIHTSSISFIDETFGTLAFHFSNEELVSKLDLVNVGDSVKQMINKIISSRRKELEELEK